MELPFLKNKSKNQGGGGPIERTASPTHDTEGQMDETLIDHVADEFFQAVETKNKKLLKEALAALISYIQEQDEIQDEGDMS